MLENCEEQALALILLLIFLSVLHNWFNFWSQVCLSTYLLVCLPFSNRVWCCGHAAPVRCFVQHCHTTGLERAKLSPTRAQSWSFQLQKRAVNSPSVKTGVYLTHIMQNLGIPCYNYLKITMSMSSQMTSTCSSLFASVQACRKI